MSLNRKKKRRITKILADVSLGAFAYLLYGLALLLPWSVALRFGAWLGSLVWFLMLSERRRVINRILFAYGDSITESQAKQIGKASLQNLGRSLMEVLQFPKLNPEKMRGVYELRGFEAWDYRRTDPDAVIIFTGHLDNWELLGARLALAGYRLSTIARGRSTTVVGRLHEKLRASVGIGVIVRDTPDVKSEIERVVTENEILAVLADQDSKKVRGVFAPFFNHLTNTPSGAIVLALRRNLPVYFVASVRTPDYRHYAQLQGPINFTNTGNLEHDLKSNATLLNKLLETAIREHPDQWVWVHNRWKTRPPLQGKEGA